MGGLFDEVKNMARLRQIELCAGVLNENGNNTSIVANSVFIQHLQHFIIFLVLSFKGSPKHIGVN